MSSHSRLRLSLNPLRHGVVAALICFCGLGIAQGQTVFWSNLDTTTSRGTQDAPSFINRKLTDVAQSFTTGDTATTLDSITISLNSISGAGFSLGLSLYTNGSSRPGTLIETLSSSAAPAIGNNVFESGSSTLLEANTTYWWVASASGGVSGTTSSLNMASAASGEALDGWFIGGASVSGSYNPNSGWGSWSGYVGDVLKFEIVATPVPEPATTAALVGLITLGVAACRRRRR